MKLIERSVESLLGELASVSPAPGGGSAAALAGAMAASLCCMVCRVTLGKKSLLMPLPTSLAGASGCPNGKRLLTSFSTC